MITIISPTTTMDFLKIAKIEDSTTPIFLDDANYLMSLLKKLDIESISNLMNLSLDLSTINHNRYLKYGATNNPRLQSILAFNGEVFNCIDISDFDEADISFGNKHLKILSGLYGILSPLDIIEPYRLEMKSKLNNSLGNDLYKFWKTKITENILENLRGENNPILINLASLEYLKAIDLKIIRKNYKFVDIIFKDYNKNLDTYKVIGLYSKKARGYMVRYIIKNKIDNLDKLKLFNYDRYVYNEKLSDKEVFVFTR
ncbi:MAG: YaaA family protein [Terrisporobacter sp.]